MYSFRQSNPRHLIPIHADNLRSSDWIILLEANTIIGPAAERLRAASATQRRKVVWRFNGLKPQPFLVIEEFDPRIHVIVFCPQLYRYDHTGALVAMRGDEIGGFIARALNDKTVLRCPWYEPVDKVADQPLITETILSEFDALLVEPDTPEHSLVPAVTYAAPARRLENAAHHES